MDTSAEAGIIHYLLAVPLLMVLGTLGHCFRAWFNVLPDKLDLFPHRPGLSNAFDAMWSNNYSFWDMLVGTEYDANGYYEFFSFKNLRTQWLWTVAPGLAVLFSYADLANAYAGVVNAAPGWLWNLLVYRIQNMKLY